ncbi:CAP domain-containing protein [Roseisalinus antarcticus]|uniref:Cysteine-rich secretory protein family protein n=1 Tax=Roseisalinus antarcticus TaxID=254357 RepID=A0A1Y5S6J5_9RHOB|nr:CAP domain-containing protein [Roseisalinus antarcticus]SLN32744.1 Cysteine-rich secretory protein family protein [Roseisalinus antarcticus]
MRFGAFLGLAFLTLTACGGSGNQVAIGPDGLPLPQIYRIAPEDAAEIQIRMLDSVNSLRQAAALPPVAYDSQLNASAATHARDMAVQNRPWHFGSDGSSPLDRARRVGFSGMILGENISESYETELETLGAWMQQPDTREVILDPRARLIGFSWYQEPAGKLWWVMDIGTTAGGAPASAPAPAAPSMVARQ